MWMENRQVESFTHQTGSSAVLSKPAATHCVFRRSRSWLALPAIDVREVMLCPEMVFVPGTPDSFSGLVHVRSEFLPVLNLGSVLPECEHSSEGVMLIVDDADGPWAMLVDEVTSLRGLEISDAPAADLFDATCIVVGWATLENAVIQILDPSRIRTFAEQHLAKMWQSPTLQTGGESQ